MTQSTSLMGAISRSYLSALVTRDRRNDNPVPAHLCHSVMVSTPGQLLTGITWCLDNLDCKMGVIWDMKVNTFYFTDSETATWFSIVAL